MTNLELAAGVIMTGFDGTELDAGTHRALSSLPFAGFILFARNVSTLEQTRALTDRLRALASPEPIVATDQEGGRIARLRTGVAPLPPMMALGATRDERLAERAGEQTAYDLRRAGVTLDFAPVVDLALDPCNTVIGTRAFGSSPQLAAAMGGAFVRGMQRAGVAATVKHFPGHGATSQDSHLTLPRLDVGLDTLSGRDLLPFALVLSSARCIMAAHVVVPGIDDALPASLSPRMLTGILRDEWHYDGVCFTDCMQMDAIAQGVGTTQGVALAIAAGADCAIVSHDPSLAAASAHHLADAVDAGRVPVKRLEEAYERVMRLRRSMAQPLPLESVTPHPAIGREIARRAVTRLRGDAHADPTACAVLAFCDASALLAQAPALVAIEPEEIAGTSRRIIVLLHRAHLDAVQRETVRALLRARPDSLLVSTAEPYDAACFPEARSAVVCYGDDAVSLSGLADVIFGDGDAKGVLPVDLGD